MENTKISLDTFQSEKSVKPLDKEHEGSLKGGHNSGEGFIPPPSW